MEAVSRGRYRSIITSDHADLSNLRQ